MVDQGRPTISPTRFGGNAQKLVAARELHHEPRVVVACQPTRGLDPAAVQLRRALLEFADRGGAVVWIAAELDELLEVADRIVVAFHGRLSDAFDRPRPASPGLAMGGGEDPSAGRGAVSLVLTRVLSVIAAFAVGAVIIAWAGENPLEIYRRCRRGVVRADGLARHPARATPLVLIGVGLGLGFKANVWNIGAEGQMIVGGPPAPSRSSATSTTCPAPC